MFNMIKAWLSTQINKAEYEKNHKTLNTARWIQELVLPKPQAGAVIPEHPHHKKRVDAHRKYLKKLVAGKSKKSIDIAFGDSIIDLIRERLKEIPQDHNFSIAGSLHSHMLQMIKDLEEYLVQLNVRSVLIGTLGGNSFLGGMPFEETKQKSLEVLNYLRKVFPVARIIVYGLPPVANIHASLNHFAFDQALYQWVLNDVNSVFMPLQKKFAGNSSVFLPQPNPEMSNDTVHLSELGAFEFNKLVKAAKTALPKTIVD